MKFHSDGGARRESARHKVSSLSSVGEVKGARATCVVKNPGRTTARGGAARLLFRLRL